MKKKMKLHIGTGKMGKTSCGKAIFKTKLNPLRITLSPLLFWESRRRCKKCEDAIHVNLEPSINL